MPGESSVFDRIAACCKSLRLDMSASEAAAFVEKNGTTPEQLGAIVDILNYLDAKKHESVINTLLRLSRLPVKAPKTFDNYEFERIQGKDEESVRNLRLLSEIHAGKNLAFIGPPGVGKTHLAEAYGRACCMEGMKAYFLKGAELKDRFVTARKYGRESRLIDSLVKPSCLIIDEIGRCVFDRESTALFFDMVDRRYEKDGANCMIFTSNRQPNEWLEFFRGDDDLKAALDRIFDNAKVITFKGESYRGRNREVLAVGCAQGHALRDRSVAALCEILRNFEYRCSW